MVENAETWDIALIVIFAIWLTFIVGFAIYFWLRVMPSIRELRKTVEGQIVLTKLIYPPRFPRNKGKN